MNKLKIYQVDAFTNKLFSGNPAAVCLLEDWLTDETMQAIAAENNLAETAFVVSKDTNFEIRWFTPAVEVDLCGHATLAAAYVLFNIIGYKDHKILLFSRYSGNLSVTKQEDILWLDFPSDKLTVSNEVKTWKACIGVEPLEVYKGKTDYIAVVSDENTVRNLNLDFDKINALNARGLIVTAKGNHVDFVSRFFGPQVGIDEDPVTGSAHTSLIPLWHKKLGKTTMTAKQLSKRGGDLLCEYQGDRCAIGGEAKLYMKGEIYY